MMQVSVDISRHFEKEIEADVQDYCSKEIYRESFARIMRLPRIIYADKQVTEYKKECSK
jgi:hypothetical protein